MARSGSGPGRRHSRQTLSAANGIGQVLVVPIAHLRLVIEEVHLAWSADHVQVDDVLRLGGEVGLRQGGMQAGLRSGSACASVPSNEPSAAAPRTLAPLKKKCRRVMSRMWSVKGCMVIRLSLGIGLLRNVPKVAVLFDCGNQEAIDLSVLQFAGSVGRPAADGFDVWQ